MYHSLAAASVFLAYASQTHLLNTDFGIAPDIRYLSPMYIPLTVFGLIILRKIQLLPESPVDLLKKMFIVGTFAVLFLDDSVTIHLHSRYGEYYEGDDPSGKIFYNLHFCACYASVSHNSLGVIS